MTCLSVASRVASQEVGGQKCSKKLFCIFPKTGSFLEPLANACIERLPMLYCEGSRLNGLGSPFGIETRRDTTVALLFEEGGLSQSRKLSFAEGTRKAKARVKSNQARSYVR